MTFAFLTSQKKQNKTTTELSGIFNVNILKQLKKGIFCDHLA